MNVRREGLKYNRGSFPFVALVAREKMIMKDKWVTVWNCVVLYWVYFKWWEILNEASRCLDFPVLWDFPWSFLSWVLHSAIYCMSGDCSAMDIHLQLVDGWWRLGCIALCALIILLYVYWPILWMNWYAFWWKDRIDCFVPSCLYMTLIHWNGWSEGVGTRMVLLVRIYSICLNIVVWRDECLDDRTEDGKSWIDNNWASCLWLHWRYDNITFVLEGVEIGTMVLSLISVLWVVSSKDWKDCILCLQFVS